jgi:predicted MPP superfamily phosphohydrolase
VIDIQYPRICPLEEMFSRKHHFRRLNEFSQVTTTSAEAEEKGESSITLGLLHEEDYEDPMPCSLQWFYPQHNSYLSSVLLVFLVLSVSILGGLGYFLTIRMGEQSSSTQVVYPTLTFTPTPKVTGTSDAYKFIILQIADIHLGEAPATDWGPMQDVKTWRALHTILSFTRPNLIIFSGDQITANDIKDNATTYYKMLGDFIESYHIPWGIIFGNHDDAPFLNTSTTTKKRSDLLKFLQQQDYKYSVTRQDSSPINVFGVSNYVLNVTLALRDSTVMAAQIILLDSGGGTLPSQIQQTQLDWISSIRLRDVPAIVFQHIPTLHHTFQDRKCVGSNGDGGIDPVSYDPGIFDFLLSDGAVHLLAVGHNHGNSYCCPTTSRNETLPLSLCFGRHSGYGGYGDFARGSRIYELNINLTTSPEDSEKSKFTLRSWVQMESGNVTELYTP